MVIGVLTHKETDPQVIVALQPSSVVVVVVDFIARIAVSVIANRTCQCSALLLLIAQGKQTSTHLCPSALPLLVPSLYRCCFELVLLEAEKERRVDW